MNSTRRSILKGATGAGALAVAAAAGLLKPTQVLAEYNTAAFGAKEVADALKGLGISSPAESTDIVIKAPDIAENGAVVPVEVTSNIPNTTGIVLLAEKNPFPLLADYQFSNGTEGYISNRIKMSTTQPVRVIVSAGGKYYTASKEVKVTIGGCGG
jgi:sulfur-oxidizing protein SoxY